MYDTPTASPVWRTSGGTSSSRAKGAYLWSADCCRPTTSSEPTPSLCPSSASWSMGGSTSMSPCPSAAGPLVQPESMSLALLHG